MPLLLQPESKRSLLTARLFPVAHPDALIGPVEVLWLAGVLTDTSGATLNRYVTVHLAIRVVPVRHYMQ